MIELSIFEGMKNGCLINILSLISGFIGLIVGVTLQVLIVGEGGPEAIGMGLVICLTFGSFHFAKKKLKNYFNFKYNLKSNGEAIKENENSLDAPVEFFAEDVPLEIENTIQNKLSNNTAQPNYFSRKIILNLLIIILILTNLLWLFAEHMDLGFLRIFSYFIWSFTLICVVLRFRLRGSNSGKKKSGASENDKSASILLGVADELAKLNKLKKEGVLTDEEFESQKNKLLS
jgi:hypothetical protein